MDIVHYKGNKLTEQQAMTISRIMTRIWNSLTEEERIEINRRINEESKATKESTVVINNS